MSSGKQPAIKITLRTKLLLASLSLLVLPWLGYQYIQGLESYLRSAQEQRLLDRVAIIASIMDDQQALFDYRSSITQPVKSESHLYVRPLHSPIQLDGYIDDWMIYEDREQVLDAEKNSPDLKVRYRLGVWKGFLYIFFQVTDDRVIYRQPESLRLDRSDHLRLGIQDREGVFRRYRLTTISPGWVSAYLMSDNLKQTLPLGPEFRIKGEWQEVPGGYNLEIRIPVEMIGNRLAFAIADVDDADIRTLEDVAANANTEKLDELGTIVIPTAQMEALLQRLQKPQSRVWVIDPGYRVIGLADELHKMDMDRTETYESKASTADTSVMHIIYRLLLDQPSSVFQDPFKSVSRFDNPAVESALAGTPKVSWRQTGNEKVSLLTAAHPVYIDNRLVGAVAIEETSNSILILQNRAIEALVNMSLLAFVLTIGVLLVFATRLSIRVRRLRNEVDASIAPDGRIRGEIKYTKVGDELGDLGRSFYDMHQRLAQYNRYLETMAGKLTHELRTPITIVRSSLDNLQDSHAADERQTYLSRANEGVERLSNILTRMSEATHLEQTIQTEEGRLFVLNDVVAACVDGYRVAHPQQKFDFIDAPAKIEMTGSAELLAQMLDKLVSNAIDFAKQHTAITISVSSQSGNVILSVANEGPPLPEEMRANLFDSMVTMRQGKSDRPHLGLGLYIVRLIAEYHRGRVEVQNLGEAEGVVFRVIMPTS